MTSQGGVLKDYNNQGPIANFMATGSNHQGHAKSLSTLASTHIGRPYRLENDAMRPSPRCDGVLQRCRNPCAFTCI